MIQKSGVYKHILKVGLQTVPCIISQRNVLSWKQHNSMYFTVHQITAFYITEVRLTSVYCTYVHLHCRQRIWSHYMQQLHLTLLHLSKVHQTIVHLTVVHLTALHLTTMHLNAVHMIECSALY